MAKHHKKSKSGFKVNAAASSSNWPACPRLQSSDSWSEAALCRPPSRKSIVIHGERQVTSLGYHNRRETEHVSMVDAGLVTQIQ